MRLYLKVIQFNFNKILTYPLESVAQGIKRFVSIAFFVLLWIAIKKSSNSEIDIRYILSYYLISSGINELIGARYGDLAKLLGREMIKEGSINNLLIKPLKIIPYLYAQSIGRTGARAIISLISILIGFIVVPPVNTFSLVIGIIFLILAVFTSFAINTLEGILFIFITDAEGIRSSINHLKSLLGGIYIPLNYFPANIRNIVEINPLASMVYIPTIAFSFTNLNNEVIKYLVFSLLWAILSNFAAILIWNFSRKKYEGVGI